MMAKETAESKMAESIRRVNTIVLRRSSLHFSVTECSIRTQNE